MNRNLFPKNSKVEKFSIKRLAFGKGLLATSSYGGKAKKK